MAAGGLALAFCCLLVTGPHFCRSASITRKQKPTCTMQSEQGVVKSGNICSFQYYYNDCDLPPPVLDSNYKNAPTDSRDLDPGTVNLDEDNSSLKAEDVKLQEEPLDTANSIVDLHITVHYRGRVLVAVNGITSRGRRQCVTVDYPERPGWSLATLSIHRLPLPHGTYNITLANPAATLPRSSFILSFRLRDKAFPPPWTNELRLNAVRSRKRRVVDGTALNDSLGQRLILGTAEATTMVTLNASAIPGTTITKWNCKKCYTFIHTYNQETAVLQLYYSVNATCPRACQNGDLRLYSHPQSKNSEQCKVLKEVELMELHRARDPRNVSKSPVDYENMETGCYMFRMLSKVGTQTVEEYGFFWIEPTISITDMSKWNTTFYIGPGSVKQSLSVRWEERSGYNFSNYKLRLWHSATQSITCEDYNKDVKIKLVPENEEILLSKPRHTFYNLSSGWYCARVTPEDDRCPSHGCGSRSSPARLVNGTTVPVTETPSPNIALIVGGSALGVMLAGVIVACCVLQCYPTSRNMRASYCKVSQMTTLSEDQTVLLVWTRYGSYGKEFEPIINAFKKILLTYSRCKVYDYLDILSLPEEQRHLLLVSPTSWVDTLLADTSIKIIIVGTEGAKLRQAEGKHLDVTHTYAEDINPQDNLLFPYLLRRLQDKPTLSGDYSRIFHVRFSDVSNNTAELEGIVSWTRYRLPEHLKDLTLSIHGKKLEGCDVEGPTAEVLKDLTSALTAHPLYRIRNGQCASASPVHSNQREVDNNDSKQHNFSMSHVSPSPTDTSYSKNDHHPSKIHLDSFNVSSNGVQARINEHIT